MSAPKSFSLQNKYLQREDITGFESERPVVYSIEEIADATSDFDETRKIGEGGYGSVYFGVLGEKEVAVKKMRSNKTKEFLAELKVLCKIHHINVVELLGYASAEDYLYLVYEYVSNGSLGDHLHDPLLKGHQPLSWTARTQIALNTTKGIEYIHDHTKSRYVHRDIKTTNILLDERLRAKVADFGLAKLVGRTNEDDFVATRLVGTPGYLPPEYIFTILETSFSIHKCIRRRLTDKYVIFTLSIHNPLPHPPRNPALEKALISALRTFNAQTGRGNKTPEIHNLAGSPKQPGSIEYGYVVMRYMRDIILDEDMYSFSTKWLCKTRASYKMGELEEVWYKTLKHIEKLMK